MARRATVAQVAPLAMVSEIPALPEKCRILVITRAYHSDSASHLTSKQSGGEVQWSPAPGYQTTLILPRTGCTLSIR